jgi:hypothetical protein
MATSTGGSPLRLFGPPNRLSFAGTDIATGDRGTLILPDSLQRYAETREIPVSIRATRRGTRRMRTRLSRTVPPGSYPAELEIAGRKYPLTIDVAEAPRLRIFPLSATFAGRPGDTAEVELTFTNGGNVAIEVPETIAVGIFDDDGIEAAFADTYRQDSDNAQELVGHWLRKLREGYGGLLKLRVVEGAGELAPAAARVVKISTALPRKLKPGHGYHGVWEFGPVFYRVAVTVQRTRTT